jgi:hypothetical protein
VVLTENADLHFLWPEERADLSLRNWDDGAAGEVRLVLLPDKPSSRSDSRSDT